ncbi:MAG: type II toxin-antitoxin system VapC family toxin [Deltaproteobacteria bacterium]|nr:type II toxin-antitoxin system VapC family toxin [Deltaproteobacteria bacterium]
MLTGLDTGFFYALQEQNPIAFRIWQERETITSVIVLYELQRKLLKGELKDWPTIISDISEAVNVMPIHRETALKASHIGHGTGMPGLDALILSSLLVPDCTEIYTTDSHMELYQKKGIKIINLYAS